ncbi:MAG: transporter [Candidatus Omnitrophota bacterium]
MRLNKKIRVSPLLLGSLFLAFSVFLTVALWRFFNFSMRDALRQEIKKEVRLAMEKELADFHGKSDPMIVLAEKTIPDHREELDQAAREVFSELKEYVAGEGIETRFAAASGVRTPPQGDSSGASAGVFEESSDPSLDSATGGKGEAKKERAIEETLMEKGGMLLPKGRFQIEPSLALAHFSSNRINIEGFSILPVLVIGEISTESVKRDVIIQTTSLKYGLLRNLQAEFRLPFRYEYDRITGNTGTESHRYSYGLGDIEFGLSRQIGWEHGWIPDTVFSLLVKTNSGRSPYGTDIGLGTGHWGIRPALVMVKSSDPAVVFGSVYYTWNTPSDIQDFGKVDPGDTIGYSLGVAIGLSYQTAVNFQFGQNVTFKMRKDGSTVKGSFLNSADFKCGFTWSFNERAAMDLGVSIGLTSDAPDYVFEIRFPYNF